MDNILPLLKRIADRYRYSEMADFVYNMNTCLDAKDPRDRIFGFLGLIAGPGASADYGASVAEVYMDATVVFLRVRPNPRLLLLHRHKDSHPVAGAPSWTVNWEHPDPPVLQKLDRYEAFNACGGAAASVFQRSRKLLVFAHSVFELRSDWGFGPRWDEFQGEQWLALKSIYSFAERMIGAHHAALPDGSKSWEETLWRTLLWDQFSLGSIQFDDAEDREDSLASRNEAAQFTQSPELRDIQQRRSAGLEFHGGVTHVLVVDTLLIMAKSHRLVVSPCKRLCMVPEQTQSGDSIHILAGGELPIVLRPRGFEEFRPVYEIVGPAYVHGMMDGEAVVDSPKRVSTGDPDAYDSALDPIWLV